MADLSPDVLTPGSETTADSNSSKAWSPRPVQTELWSTEPPAVAPGQVLMPQADYIVRRPGRSFPSQSDGEGNGNGNGGVDVDIGQDGDGRSSVSPEHIACKTPLKPAHAARFG